jgi:hypothetical protein
MHAAFHMTNETFVKDIPREPGYGVDDREVGARVPVESRIFSTSRPAVGPIQRPIQWIPVVFSSEEKRPGREADHL